MIKSFLLFCSISVLSILGKQCGKNVNSSQEMPIGDYERYTQRMTNNHPYYFTPVLLDSVVKFFDEISVEKNGCYLMLIENGQVYKCCSISIVNEDTIARYFLAESQIINMPLEYFKDDFCQDKNYKLFLPKVYFQEKESD